jgi:hypothetical protein
VAKGRVPVKILEMLVEMVRVVHGLAGKVAQHDRDMAQQLKRTNSTSTPVTSGASVRRPSSSSSCPVWSPSSTTIVGTHGILLWIGTTIAQEALYLLFRPFFL